MIRTIPFELFENIDNYHHNEKMLKNWSTFRNRNNEKVDQVEFNKLFKRETLIKFPVKLKTIIINLDNKRWMDQLIGFS